ncbi:MAG TPA: hypothetical protein VG345_16480 [Bryobacteraceae bacterium]|nr:hypothetical protein [Bryobacteraceae bacterium]
MTFEQMTNALVNLDKMRSSNTGGGSLETNPIVKSLMEAALPALGALLTKLLTPTDPLAAIQTATNTFKTIQELGGGGGGKDDIGTTVVKNLPALLERGGSILAELRAMEELRRNNLILMSQRNPAAIVPATHVTPANPAAPAAPLSAVPGIAPAAPIVITPDSEGRPSPEWVFRQIVAMVNKGDSGGFVFDFLDSMELSLEVGGKAVLLVDIIHGATLEQVRDFIGKDPILGVLAQSPRYEEFCKEFHAALSAREPKQPLPN